MEVTLISMTPEPLKVMYVAARTCYSAKEPKDILEDYTREKAEKLLDKVLGSGHGSIAEHVNFTFAINGTDRVVSHQLVRHRLATYSQQSQRYVEIKESADTIRSVLQRDDIREMDSLASKYFTVNGVSEIKICLEALLSYRKLIEEDGLAPEEARAVLPNCTKTNIVMTCNLRQLTHICSLRLCTRAQEPIRNVFREIAKLVNKEDPYLGKFLVPSCMQLGFCPEEKCCGRKPTLKQMKEDLRELARAELHRMNAEIIIEEIKKGNDIDV